MVQCALYAKDKKGDMEAPSLSIWTISTSSEYGCHLGYFQVISLSYGRQKRLFNRSLSMEIFPRGNSSMKEL